jgi:TonB family protein
MSLTLIAAFFISLFMHAGLVIFGPDIHYSDPPDIETDPVEVSMIAREVPIPDALRLKPLPLVSKPAPLALKRLLEKPVGLQASLKPSFKADPTLQRIKKAPKSRPLAGAPKLNLPKRVTTLDQLTRAKLKTLAKAGEEEAFPLAVPAPSAGLGGRKISVLKDRASQFVGEELTRLTKERAPVKTRRSISGPAATRRIIFRPPPPKAGFSGSSGDITLRFWVLSDGTIGRVIPVRKGNADLEGVAANHMKRWRFSPLPPGVPEREEWGLVVFRFRVR